MGLKGLKGLMVAAVLLAAARTFGDGDIQYDVVVYRDMDFAQWSPVVTARTISVTSNGGAWAASQTGTWHYALSATNDKGRTVNGPVTNTSVTVTGAYVTIVWKPAGGATGYLLWRGSTATNLTNFVALGGSSTSYVDYGTNAWTTGTPTNTVTYKPRARLWAGYTATGLTDVATLQDLMAVVAQTGAFDNAAAGANIQLTTNGHTLTIGVTNVVDLGTAQTVTGNKTFSGNPKFTGGPTSAVFAAYLYKTVGNSEANYGTNATAFGVGNKPQATNSTIGGGATNTITGAAVSGVIGGGEINTNSGQWASILGGRGNVASAEGATVGGGQSNRADGVYTTVGGGKTNVATGGTVAGGQGNQASGGQSAIGGGDGNIASGDHSTIAGGWANAAAGTEATVGGGYQNTAPQADATVAGGGLNAATGLYSTVGGGVQNVAGGQYSTVPGGLSNTANGAFAFAAGHHAKAADTGSFVWADASAGDFSSTNKNSFRARATGGVRFETSGAGLEVDGHRVYIPTNPYVLLWVDANTNIVEIGPGANGSSLISSGPSSIPGFGIPVVQLSNVTFDALLDVVATNFGAGFIPVWDPSITNWVTKQTTNALAAADVLTLVKQVDGPGSGLDSDTVDGYDSAAFALLAGADYSGTLRASARFSSANAGQAVLTNGVCFVTLPVAMTDAVYAVSLAYKFNNVVTSVLAVTANQGTTGFTVNGDGTNRFLWTVTDY